MSKGVTITIDGTVVGLPEAGIDLSLSYSLESSEDFRVKTPSEGLNIALPATMENTRLLSENTAILPVSIEVDGRELLVGKCKVGEQKRLTKVRTINIDCYGDNADWVTVLGETTLYDTLRHISFPFTKAFIESTWAYDGQDEKMPFVFAPVRYREAFDDGDNNVTPGQLRPALSLYWLLRWGFKKAGYSIQSDFLNTSYIRQAVLPWTWGNFLFSEGTKLDELKFLAKGVESFERDGENATEYIDANVSNDTTNGGFDNSNVYAYDAASKAMTWTYQPALNYGTIDAGFHINVFLDAFVSDNSDMHLWVEWFKNGTSLELVSLKQLEAPPGLANKRTFIGQVQDWKTITVSPGDMVTAKLKLRTFDSNLGRCTVKLNVDEFSIQYFRIPLGGTVDFANFSVFKRYKFLDLLRGVVDLFNLQVNTDSIKREVLIEPTHQYKISGQTIPGYFNGQILEWTAKADESKESTRRFVRDIARECILTFEPDENDGLAKKLRERYQHTPAAAKYVYSSRFTEGTKELKNRFFSPLMHIDADQFKSITGIAPQFPAIVPENISNTSRDEAQNSFKPKLAWYKGNVSGFGGWRFDGQELSSLPFMFAVNYKDGGQYDPVFSYCNERIAGQVVAGLLQKFFLQRFANTQGGVTLEASFMLNNSDVTNWYHREHIAIDGKAHELIAIENYRPLEHASTQCLLREHVPMLAAFRQNIYPSGSSVLDTGLTTAYDTKYIRLVALPSDLPR